MDFKTLLEISRREVFILRVWRTSEHNSPLRGQIQHVMSNKVFTLREPEKILLSIQEEVEATERKSTPTEIK